MEAELKALSKNFNAASEVAPTVELMGEEDQFLKNFTAFADRAKVELAGIEDSFKKANEMFNSVLAGFGEDPKVMGPEEFFGVWKAFCGKIVEIDSKIEVEREKADKIRKREEAKQKRDAAAAPAPAAAGAAPAEGGAEGAPGGEEAAATGEEGGAEGGSFSLNLSRLDFFVLTFLPDDGAGRGGRGGARGAARGATRGAVRGATRGATRGAARGGRGGAGAGGDPAVVDELFAKMQQGNVFAARRTGAAQ